jgi:Uma2 family endonuclease
MQPGRTARVATAPVPHSLTADDLSAMPDDGNRYELVRGELIPISPLFILPSVVAGNVLGEIGQFVRRQRLGVYGTAGGFKLESNPDTVRAPDVWFIRADRIPADGLPDSFWPGAPDLAVEVLSPSDRFVEVMRKVQEYLAAGARLVWVIDPKGRSAAAFAPDRPSLLFGEDDTLDGGDFLPSFVLRLGDVLP